MPITVRILGPGDEAVFENIDADVFDGPVQSELVHEFLNNPRHHIAVALTEAGKLIGMATGVHFVHPDKSAQLFINEAGVAEAYQGQGIGRRVLDALLEHGRKLGCGVSWVATENDDAARALYRSAGGLEAPDSIVMYTFPLAAPGKSEKNGSDGR